MKKSLLIFSAITLLGFQGYSQQNPRNPLTTGVKAGLNLSNISAGKNSQDMRPSFHAGAVVELPLSYYKKYALQFELLYSNQGYNGKEVTKVDKKDGSVIETNKLDNASLHYLNVPILFKYYATENFSIEVGPQFGFLMDASGGFDIYKYNEYRELFVSSDSNLDNALDKAGYGNGSYKKFYESIDYGVNIGISYVFDNGIFISGRYYMGLQDIYKYDNEFTKIPIPKGTPEVLVKQINEINKELDFTKAKNSVFQVSFGYKF